MRRAVKKAILWVLVGMLMEAMGMRSTQAREHGDGGVKVIYVPKPDVGLVFIDVVALHGAFMDPKGKEGTALLTSKTMLRGTEQMSYKEIMDAVSLMGANVSASATKETIWVHGVCMPKHLDRFVDILAQVVEHPIFPKEEFAIERNLLLEDLHNMRNDDAELARYFFSRFLYRGHPLSRPTSGSIGSVEKIMPRDCAEFHAKAFRRGNVVIVVAGSVTRAQVRRLTERLTADLGEGRSPRFHLPGPPHLKGIHLLVVDKPGRTQVQVVMGAPGPGWDNPDVMPLVVGNTAFGGTFTSRLTREIREKRGLSYGAGSSVHSGRSGGTVTIHFFPATQNVLQTITTALDLLKEVTTKGIKREEVEFAKRHLINEFPFKIQTPRHKALELLMNLVLVRPPDYLERYRDMVSKVTLEEVNTAMRRYLTPENLVITMVATADDVLDVAKKIPGIVELVVQPYDKDVFPARGDGGGDTN